MVSCIMEALNTQSKSLNGASVLVLGIAYKKDVKDIRESPSLKLILLLQEKGAKVCYNDPYIPQIGLAQDNLTSVNLAEEYLGSVDCTIIAADHSCYDLEQIVSRSKLVFDTRGATRGLEYTNIVRLGE